jgi:hypothetical protein
MPDPNTLFGDDSRPNTRPIYCYIVRQLDIDDVPPLFLTQYDGEVVIGGMPGVYNADSTQIFTPVNIGHGPISREGSFDKATFEVRTLTQDMAGISRYAMTGAVPRIQVDIVKVNPGRVIAGDTANWAADTIVVQSGLMSSFGFKGYTVVVECVPPPLFSGHEVPRCRFTRTCNHVLFGSACRVDPEPFTLETNILQVMVEQRRIRIQGVHADDAGNYFRQGVCLHQPTGMRLSVEKSEIEAGDTVLKLTQWSPDLNVNDVVVVRAGCKHTFVECRDKFANAHNFGGFSTVPNKNPTLHGI